MGPRLEFSRCMGAEHESPSCSPARGAGSDLDTDQHGSALLPGLPGLSGCHHCYQTAPCGGTTCGVAVRQILSRCPCAAAQPGAGLTLPLVACSSAARHAASWPLP